MSEEAIIALPGPASAIKPATHVRGSVIVSSLRSLRTRDLHARYVAALPAEYREEVHAVVASVWTPIDLAVAHYRACDALALPAPEIEAIGAESGAFLNHTVVSVVVRMSRELGTTPWAILGLIEKLRERLWRGGAFAVYKLGPKEARIEWHGQPCAAVPYYRTAFGAFIRGVMLPFCRVVYVTELPRYCTATTLGYRVSWA